MERTERLAGTPALIVSLAAVLGILALRPDDAVREKPESTQVVTKRLALDAELPLIGELTVTASRG